MRNTMTLTELIDRVLELDKKATPGPWRAAGIQSHRDYVRTNCLLESEDKSMDVTTNIGGPDEDAIDYRINSNEWGVAHRDATLISEYRNAAVKLAKILKLVIDPDEEGRLEPKVQKILDEK